LNLEKTDYIKKPCSFSPVSLVREKMPLTKRISTAEFLETNLPWSP